MSKIRWTLVVSLIVAVYASEARAQSDCKQLVESGQAAARSKLYDEAQAIYQRAYKRCADPVILVHIAKAYQDAEDFEKALRYAERFLAEAESDHPLYDALTGAAEELREKVKATKSGGRAAPPSISKRGEDMSRSIDDVDHLRPRSYRLNSAKPFTILDRPADDSAAGIDVSLALLTDSSDLFILRLEPHLEHRFTDEIGALATLVVTQVFVSDGENQNGLGNLDLGAFYVRPLGEDTDLVVRGSVTLPTAGSDDVIVNVLSASSRLGDLAVVVPDIVTARTAASVIHHVGSKIMLRADLGLDTPLFATGDAELGDRNPLVHFSAGAAWGARTKLVGELVNLYSTEDLTAEDFVHQLALGISHHVGMGAIRGGVSILIDTYLADDQDDLLSVNVGYAQKY